LKKETVIYLGKVAKKLPLVFKEEISKEPWLGKDLMLTPYADDAQLRLRDFGSEAPLDPDEFYWVPIPAFRAVMHIQQLKDAWKKNGQEGVNEYVLSVIRSVLQKKNSGVVAIDYGKKD
jgi:hypothetical protein